eukprot:4888672-Alexandrium_andersonii.AAC.1
MPSAGLAKYCASRTRHKLGGPATSADVEPRRGPFGLWGEAGSRAALADFGQRVQRACGCSE